jgi:1-acyl-sn-glycerol-3-phosphate acyltransferase
MRGKTGVARLALAAGGDIPVIPMATWGVQDILPRYGKLRILPPRRRVRIRLGAPVDLSAFTGTTPGALSGATDAVMRDISALLGELRGEQPPAERWNPAQHGQKEIGRLDP